ncbi:zinc-binding domain-domain-containing protein [Fusarium flagelliforme]|uniref:Zinc-binding domain-domain-containing protein n=1 Tax=Fusarium flagelliforme TaxID=2675880 RepID=A0A395N4K2_9HYPO|nr:zinc-binding domain-domain-containing protein [Fusarium flagelliforme]
MSNTESKAASLEELSSSLEKLSLDEISVEEPAPEIDLPKNTSTEATLPADISLVKVSPETASPNKPATEEPPAEEQSTEENSLEKISSETTTPEKSVNEKAPAKKPATKTEEQKEWFMCPHLDEQVRLQLAEDGIGYYTFNPDNDDDSATNTYSTNIMGRFACSNKRCRNKWRSLLVAITIRVYDGYRYNAKLYNQQCKDCKALGVPEVFKRSYVDRVSYRIKKWHGVEMGAYQRGEDIESEGQHKSKFCEGCKKGLCKGRELRQGEDSD